MEQTMKTLGENTYFAKYEKKILNLQKSSPLEFESRIGVYTENQKIKPSSQDFSKVADNGKQPQSSGVYTFPLQKKLDSLMKVDMLKLKNADEITCIFEKILDRATEYPTFIFPLPRNEGYEFIVSQFAGSEVHFTLLVNYQSYQENAPECLTMIHYPDLAEEKGIVLMQGEFDVDILNGKEAQFLANQVRLFYGGDDEVKLELLNQFTRSPASFRHMDLIKQLEEIDLSAFTKDFKGSK